MGEPGSTVNFVTAAWNPFVGTERIEQRVVAEGPFGPAIREMFGPAVALRRVSPSISEARPARSLRVGRQPPNTALVKDPCANVPLQNSLVPRKRQGFAM